MLNNNQLAHLYLSFQRDYKDLSAQNSDFELISQILTNRLNQSFHHQASTLYHASQADQVKAHRFLKIYLESQAANRGIRVSSLPPPYNLQEQYPLRGVYCPRKEAVFNWRQLDAFMSYKMYHAPLKNLSVKYFAGTVLLYILGLLKTVLTGIALYCILNQTLNSLERFIYNEGWQQAAITLASMAAGAVAGAALGMVVAGLPFFCLSAASLMTVASLSLLGAAVSSGLVNWAQANILEKNHSTALDPEDPFRFTLTVDEEQNLINRQIDPLKVLCAMTALRMQMGTQGSASFIGRMFRDKHQIRQQNLMLIRQIRSGELEQVMAGDQLFDLRSAPNYLHSQGDAHVQSVYGYPQEYNFSMGQ